MKILISSHAYAPSIGGIETVSALLAGEFYSLGHEITIVTQTPGPVEENAGVQVIRQPPTGELFRLLRWCDVFWQNNLSLRTLWPALLLRKPVVITHQGSYTDAPRGVAVVLRMKHAVVNRLTSVAPSQFVATAFKVTSTIIPNPYDARLFTSGRPTSDRPDDLVFLGRLVSEKGLDVLLNALSQLKATGLTRRLTVAGSGPELVAMQTRAETLGVSNQVTFAGAKRGQSLGQLLQQHKILVVPSRYNEAFGVVALEGIASGCVVVGSSGGGLPEAIGPCGICFPNGDAAALASVLGQLLREPNQYSRFTANAADHLARFHPRAVADAYLALFKSKLP